MSSDSSLADKLAGVQQVLRKEYTRKHASPWVIAYSGGKDSTLLLHLVWELLLALPAGQRRRKIFVVSNDTLVESPLVIDHLKNSLSTINKAAAKQRLPIESHLTTPNLDQSFWVNVIGKGYIPPTRNFRWCTDRLKIIPTNALLKKLVIEHRKVILLIGSRLSESQNRKRAMLKHGVTADTMNKHGSIDDCLMFSPLADLTNDDVWTLLMQRKPPWGGTHRRLITLYKNAGGGECPLVISKDDAPSCGSSSPRFGCWTCTVVEKDKSMQGSIAAGHKDEEMLEALLDFRNWLAELRADRANRMDVRRDGSRKINEEGELTNGPFKMHVRRKILEKLQEMEEEFGSKLISGTELAIIKETWRRDAIKEDGRSALLDHLKEAFQ